MSKELERVMELDQEHNLRGQLVQVYHMQTAYGQHTKEAPNFHVNEKAIKELVLRYNLISEELLELTDNWNKRDMQEVVDALCDILVVTLGTNLSLQVYPTRGSYEGMGNLFDLSYQIVDVPKNVFISTIQQYYKILENYVIGMKNSVESIQTLLDHVDSITKGAEELNAAVVQSGCMQINDFYVSFQKFSGLFFAIFFSIADNYKELNLLDNFNRVMESNMQKFAKDRNEAEETVNSYALANIPAAYEPFVSYNKEGQQIQLWRIVRTEDGKVLKKKGWVKHDIDVGNETL